MRVEFPEFRLGTVLATSFTGTLSERHGDAVERIPTPGRLADWLAVYGLAVDSCAPGGAAAGLTPVGERRWQRGAASPVADALGVIAADAISFFAGERDGNLA